MSHRQDKRTREIADRHYNRQKPGTKGFVPPGRCLVLRTRGYNAFWVTSFPYGEYVLHDWAGATVCSAFRNEAQDKYLSSDLVREAVACTVWMWPETRDVGMITFIDPNFVRKKRDFGRCFRKVGFIEVGRTVRKKLIALHLDVSNIEPLMPMEPKNLPINTLYSMIEAQGKWK